MKRCRRLLACLVLLGLILATFGSQVADASATEEEFCLVEINGARVLYRQSSADDEQSSIFLVMLAGFSDQGPNEAHFAHAAEHMIFLNRQQGEQSLVEMISECGGSANGFTTTDYTSVQILVGHEHLVPILKALINSLFPASINPQALQEELAGYFALELSQVANNMPQAGYHAFQRQLLRGTPYDPGTLDGTTDHIQPLPLQEWMQREYSPERLIMAVQGNTPLAEVASTLRQGLAFVPPGPAREPLALRFNPSRTDEFAVSGKAERRLLIGFGIDQIAPEDQPYLPLLLQLVEQSLRYTHTLGIRADQRLFTTTPFGDAVIWQAGYRFLQNDADYAAIATQLNQELQELLDRLATYGPGLGEIDKAFESVTDQSPPGIRGAASLAAAANAVRPYLPGLHRYSLPELRDLDRLALQAKTQALAAKYLPAAQIHTLHVYREASLSVKPFIIIGWVIALFGLGYLSLRRAVTRSPHVRLWVTLFTTARKSLTRRSTRTPSNDEAEAWAAMAMILIGFVMFFVAMALSHFLISLAAAAGQPGLVFVIGICAASLILLLTGFPLLSSVFYQSRDTERLLALPLTPGQVVSAKLAVVASGQLAVACVCVVPPILTYANVVGLSVSGWLTALLVLLLLPVLPLVLAGLLLIPFMRLLSRRQRDLLRMFGSVLSALIYLALRFGSYAYRGRGAGTLPRPEEADLVTRLVMLRQVDLLSSAGWIFPPAVLASRAIVAAGSLRGWAYLATYILVNIAGVFALTQMANRWFLQGAQSMQEAPSRGWGKRWRGEAGVRRPIAALFCREWRTFWREPQFFAISIAGLLTPLVTLIPFFSGRLQTAMFQGMTETILQGSNGPLYACLLAAGVAVMSSYLSSIGLMAVSREGRQLYISKAIPVPFRTQLYAKLLQSLATLWVIVGPILVAFLIRVRPPVLLALEALLLGIAGSTFATALAISLDLGEPKIDWDDVRQMRRGGAGFLLMLATGALMLVSVWVTSRLLAIAWPSWAIMTVLLVGWTAAAAWQTNSLLFNADRGYQRIEL